MFTNVVWASDGSEYADRALEYAKQLLPKDRGTLHVVHIVEKLAGPRVAGQDANVNEAEIEAKIRAQARAAEHDGLRVRMHLVVGHGGSVFRLIADEATDAGADLIVVGTRGHSALVGAVIGSVTQNLLHVAGCPVLAVPPLRNGAQEPDPADDTIARVQ